MDYKDKYLKYKSKYLQLKNIYENQKGGANNYKLDLTRYDNKYIQDIVLKKNMLIEKDLDISNPENLPIHDYKILLNNLMKRDTKKTSIGNIIADDEINLDFLNTISAFPADLRKQLNIGKKGNEYTFDGKSNYNITQVISDGTTGSEAIILRLKKNEGVHESLPEELVLKLMPIKIENYYNYTPLTFQHITVKPPETGSADTRYYNYTIENFDKLNLDKQYLGYNLNSNNENIYITAADLDDFKNEMIQNIICRNILGDDNKNLINYYNYIYININGYTYGGILMESLNGSLDQLIKDEIQKNVGTNILEDNFFSIALKNYLTELNKLKHFSYRFNHSDLKVQNIFYKKNIDNSYILKIADLDKSAITFNGIRFINGKLINKSLDLMKLSEPPVIKDNYINIPEDIARDLNIEWEQIYLRYGFFPPPPFYDILVLFICLRIHFYSKLEEFKKYCQTYNLDNFIQELLGREYDIITETDSVNASLGPKLINENDYGEIINQTIITNKIKIPVGYNDNFKSYHGPNKIELSKHNKKLILSGKSKYGINTTVKKKWGVLQSSTTWKSDDNNVEIFYTGNYTPKDDIYYNKTNRYRYRILIPVLFEWDTVDEEIDLEKEPRKELSPQDPNQFPLETSASAPEKQ